MISAAEAVRTIELGIIEKVHKEESHDTAPYPTSLQLQVDRNSISLQYYHVSNPIDLDHCGEPRSRLVLSYPKCPLGTRDLLSMKDD